MWMSYHCLVLVDIELEWREMGWPPKLLGFSREPSLGLEWAKSECLRQAGEVSMAVLTTHLAEARQFLEEHYLDRSYWVDAYSSGSKLLKSEK